MTDIKLDSDISAALELALSTSGRTKVLQVLSDIAGKDAIERNTLTIVANEGVHHLSGEYKRGEVFIASRGSLDLSSTESVHNEFRRVMRATAQKLKSRAWKRVYIIPFGPAPLSMQIKLLVYRVCGFESIDVMNAAGNVRIDVALDLRDLIVDSDGDGRS